MHDHASNHLSVPRIETMLRLLRGEVYLAVLVVMTCPGHVFADKWSGVAKILRGARYLRDEDLPESLSWDALGVLVVFSVFVWSCWVLLTDACRRCDVRLRRSDRFLGLANRMEPVFTVLLYCIAASAAGAGIAYVAAPFIAHRRLENRILIGGAGCGIAVYVLIGSLLSRCTRKRK
jgi:hypothetical protein